MTLAFHRDSEFFRKEMYIVWNDQVETAALRVFVTDDFCEMILINKTSDVTTDLRSNVLHLMYILIILSCLL